MFVLSSVPASCARKTSFLSNDLALSCRQFFEQKYNHNDCVIFTELMYLASLLWYIKSRGVAYSLMLTHSATHFASFPCCSRSLKSRLVNKRRVARNLKVELGAPLETHSSGSNSYSQRLKHNQKKK